MDTLAVGGFYAVELVGLVPREFFIRRRQHWSNTLDFSPREVLKHLLLFAGMNPHTT